MSEQFIDLKVKAECVLLILGVTSGSKERKALLRELRVTIENLDREVGNSLPALLGAGFIEQMNLLGLP